MYPVEFVIRLSRTHRSPALAFLRSRGLSNYSISLGNVWSTSRPELDFSKYPLENPRQVSVSISELPPATLAHSAHFILILVFNFLALPLEIEARFQLLD